MNNTLLLFDFDGTIADTFLPTVDISNKLAREFNFKEITPDKIDFFKGKTSQEVRAHLDIPILKIPKIISEAKKEFSKCIDSVEPIEGLSDILYEIKELGEQIGIFTSNSIENVKKFLVNHDLDFFDFIQSTSSIWGKNVGLTKLMKEQNISADRLIYIGDETRDIEAAKKAGIKVIAVGWGYNTISSLKKHNPDYIAEKPSDLIEIIKNFLL